MVRTWLGIALALLIAGLPGRSQQAASQDTAQHAPQPQDIPQKPPEQNPGDTFFAGTLSECSAEKIFVSRVVSGKTENRPFKLTPETKIETAAGAKWDTGKLRVKQRVTVRYMTSDDGDVATLIVVRTTQQKQK